MSSFAFDGTLLRDWLCTFAVHSTLALGSALLASLLLGRRALAVQETMLRASLWVALFSASAQCALRGVWMPELVWSPDGPGDVALPVLPASGLSLDGSSALDDADPGLPWGVLLVAGVVAAAGSGLGWLFVVHRRLRRVLRARRPETDARVLTTAAEVARSLGLRQSPHLSRSDAIATPIAFGMLRPEICLPMRVGELSHASLRAMLAHEVAHLRAADPAWMWGAAWLQALFPWQPLFAAVRRRWARLVELRCDAIAAEHATPTAVARCLLDVAEWLRPGPEGTVAALGMAARPSALRERVEAALQGGGFRPARRGVGPTIGGLLLLALTAGAPAVASAADATDVLLRSALRSDAEVPAESRRFSRSALLAAASVLDAEYASLLADVDGLRTEMKNGPGLAADSLAALERRLQVLARMRSKLTGLLAEPASNDR